MTDRERYKRTFSKLHASEEILLEVNNMKKIKIMPVRRLVAVAAAAMLIAAMATVAYANDVGGIQRHFQIWLNGMPVEVEFSMPDEDTGSYVISYKDDNGEEQMVYGHIASVDIGEADGEADAAAMKSLTAPQVEYRDDGTVWVHYNGKDMEITDLFEDGVCQLELETEQFETEDGEVTKSQYLTIQYGDGSGYVSTRDFVSSIGGDHGSTWIVTDDGTAVDGDNIENP